MTKQEMLKYDPKKSMRKELLAFAAFSLFVMVPMAITIVKMISK